MEREGGRVRGRQADFRQLENGLVSGGLPIIGGVGVRKRQGCMLKMRVECVDFDANPRIGGVSTAWDCGQMGGREVARLRHSRPGC